MTASHVASECFQRFLVQRSRFDRRQSVVQNLQSFIRIGCLHLFSAEDAVHDFRSETVILHIGLLSGQGQSILLSRNFQRKLALLTILVRHFLAVLAFRLAGSQLHTARSREILHEVLQLATLHRAQFAGILPCLLECSASRIAVTTSHHGNPATVSLLSRFAFRRNDRKLSLVKRGCFHRLATTATGHCGI